MQGGVIKDWCSLHPFFGYYQILNFGCFEIKLKAENLDETSNCGSTWNFEFFKSYFAIASFMDRGKKANPFPFHQSSFSFSLNQIFKNRNSYEYDKSIITYLWIDESWNLRDEMTLVLFQSTFLFLNIFRLLVQSSTLLRFQNHVKGYWILENVIGLNVGTWEKCFVKNGELRPSV